MSGPAVPLSISAGRPSVWGVLATGRASRAKQAVWSTSEQGGVHSREGPRVGYAVSGGYLDAVVGTPRGGVARVGSHRGQRAIAARRRAAYEPGTDVSGVASSSREDVTTSVPDGGHDAVIEPEAGNPIQNSRPSGPATCSANHAPRVWPVARRTISPSIAPGRDGVIGEGAAGLPTTAAPLFELAEKPPDRRSAPSPGSSASGSG